MINLLSGVRVLETAVLFNGDQTSRLLGDLGADVIKVESPGVGDIVRVMLGELTPGNSPSHLFANRNKRSVTIDLRTPEGRGVFFDLLRTADIFVDGFAGATAHRLGIGYEEQRKVKPDIIYAQCSGFGASGPYANVPTHGMMMGALAGAVRLSVDEQGLVEESGTSLGDGSQVGAMFTAMTALAALAQRQRTGEGAYIDGAGSDAVLATAWLEPLHGWNEANMERFETIQPMGGARYRAYLTADDRFLLFCCAERKFWEGFCRAVGREDLLECFGSGPVDYGNADQSLIGELAAIFRSGSLEQWMDLAASARLPIGPANRPHELLDDPQLAVRQVVIEETHPDAGPFTTIGWPAPVLGQPFGVHRHAPALGADTDDVLAELGYEPERIAVLRAAGAI